MAIAAIKHYHICAICGKIAKDVSGDRCAFCGHLGVMQMKDIIERVVLSISFCGSNEWHKKIEIEIDKEMIWNRKWIQENITRIYDAADFSMYSYFPLDNSPLLRWKIDKSGAVFICSGSEFKNCFWLNDNKLNPSSWLPVESGEKLIFKNSKDEPIFVFLIDL